MRVQLPPPRFGEENHVVVGLNGTRWQIMRGVEVDVPEAVGEILAAGERARREAEQYQERVSR